MTRSRGAKQQELGKTTFSPHKRLRASETSETIFLCLHVSKLANYKKATGQRSYTRHISISKQSNFRSEKGAKTISNAHFPKSLFFPLAPSLLEMLPLLSHVCKPKAEVRNKLFSGRGPRWGACLCWTAAWVRPPPRRKPDGNRRQMGVLSLPSDEARPEASGWAGPFHSHSPRPQKLGQCSLSSAGSPCPTLAQPPNVGGNQMHLQGST